MNTDQRTGPAATSTALHTSDATVTDPPGVPGQATAAEPPTRGGPSRPSVPWA